MAELARNSSMPDLSQYVKAPYMGLTTGPWARWVDAKWLGPYAPSNVAMWQRKLMRRDPQIKLGLMALKAPFFGIDYRVEGGDPRTRAFVREALVERPLFKRLVWSILNAIDFGFQCHELEWDLADVAINYAAEGGVKVHSTLERAYVLRALADIDPERVIPIVDEHGDLDGVRVDGVQYLPGEKILHAVHQFEWKNHWGTAVVDSSFNPWYWNNFFYLFVSRYLEAKGNPPLKGTAPWDSRFLDRLSPGGQVPVRATDWLAEQAIQLRGGGVCVMPWEVDEKGNQMWTLDVLEDGGRVDQFLPMIQHNESMKLRGVLVPERVATQDGSVGSYASSDVHLEVFFGIMEIFKNFLILGTINEGVVPRLVRYNFGKSAPVPQVSASELNRTSKQLLCDILKMTAGMPRKLKDGRVYSIAEVVDAVHALEALNVPHLEPEDVAHFEEPKPSAPAPRSDEKAEGANKAAGLARALGLSIEHLTSCLELARECEARIPREERSQN